MEPFQLKEFEREHTKGITVKFFWNRPNGLRDKKNVDDGQSSIITAHFWALGAQASFKLTKKHKVW